MDSHEAQPGRVMASFDSIAARLARATEQAVVVKNAIEPFTDSMAHKLVPEKNVDGTEHSLRVHFDPQIDSMRVGILFGEFVHQLRSALDNLAWQLVLCSGNTPDTSTEFPIFKNPADFQKRAPRKMQGMKPLIRAEIERHQPFAVEGNNPEATAIWFVHGLDIIDKHRIIVPVAIGAVKGNVSYFPPAGATLKQADRPEHGEIFVTICLPNPVDKVKVKADITFAVAINYANSLYRVDDLLRRLPDEISGIAEDFRQFIERP